MTALAKRIALVTGASRGIGAAIAKHLGAAGAFVYVNYAKGEHQAQEVVAHIQQHGGQACAVQADFSNEGDIRRLYAQIAAERSSLDILVNNAGVFDFHPVELATADEFHRQFNLNVLGVLLSTQAALPLMSEGGSIINLGSVVGIMPPPNTAIYSATKAAVHSLTITLSKELGSRGIRVNSLNPGLTETEGSMKVGAGEGSFRDATVATTPLGRLGQAEDMGPVAVFLASPAAGWVNGQAIYVNGGQTA